MATDAAAVYSQAGRARLAWTLADTVFVLFLLLIFVGLEPFATRDPAALAAGESGFGGAGDIVREIAYLGGFLLIAFTGVVLHNFLESDFLEGDDPAWVAFLLMLAMLREVVARPRKVRLP